MAGEAKSIPEERWGDVQTISSEELGTYRQRAQQTSVEAIRAAEERYAKAKQSGERMVDHSKDAAAVHCLDGSVRDAAKYPADKAVALTDSVVRKSHNGYHRATAKTQQAYTAAKEIAASAGGATVDHARDMAGQSIDHATEKTAAAKEVAAEGGNAAVEASLRISAQAKEMAAYASQKVLDYAANKAGEAKDAAVQRTSSALSYAGQKVGEAKGSSVGAAQSTVNYINENKQMMERDGSTTKSANKKGGETKNAGTVANNEEVLDAGLPATEYAGQRAGEDADRSGFTGTSHAKDRVGHQTEQYVSIRPEERSVPQQSRNENGKVSKIVGEPNVFPEDKSCNKDYKAEDLEESGLRAQVPVIIGGEQAGGCPVPVDDEAPGAESKGGILEAVGAIVIGIGYEALELLNLRVREQPRR